MRSMQATALFGMSLLLLSAGGLPAAPPEALPARMMVRLPADAMLTLNGQPTTSTSATRFFVTPPLERGKEYSYTLRATLAQSGETIILEKKVTVLAGRETLVSLDLPQARRWYELGFLGDLYSSDGRLRGRSPGVAGLGEQSPMNETGPPTTHGDWTPNPFR
jgi:uncharacterized protein (TIGR03000 family)